MTSQVHGHSGVDDPVTARRQRSAVALIGGPTTVIDIAGVRLVSDPTFDPPGDFGYLRKTDGPAVAADALGEVDAVLLSHDQHSDNFDHAGRAFALSTPVILTPPSAAARLGQPARPLALHESWTSPNGRLTVTALPAQHGPADGERDDDGFINSEVIGFLLESAEAEVPRLYVSGDNASIELVHQIRERYGPIDHAVLHVGAASVPAKFGGRPLSLTPERASAAAEVLDAHHVIAVHQDGWTHFTQGAEATRQAFDQAGIGTRLHAIRPGRWCHLR